MFNKLKKYLEQNNLEHDFEKVELRDDGDGVIYIGIWGYDIPQPTIDELEAIDASSIEAKLEIKQLDLIVPRHIEDLLTGIETFGKVKEVIERKKELRKLL